MKKMSQYLLGVVTHSLWGGSPAQRPIFNCALECTQALSEFYMYAWYKSHDDATLSYMEDALHHFHPFKDVFLLRRASKKGKAKANALRTELVNKRKVDEETNAETWTPSKKRREMNAWRDYISHEIDIFKELDADFNFPKTHLISHWAEHIRRYGALQQYSAERQEHAHKINLKDGWNASNHNLNYLPQVITFQHRILCFEIRELNLQALAQCWEISAAACKVFPSSAVLAAPLSSQSYAKPEFMRPQNRHDGKHPDAMIKDFRELLDNTQDATHRAAIYSATREFRKHKSRNKTYISDEQLHAMELCIYHSIKVQVEGLEGEHISQMCRCPGSQRWRGGDRRNDWVWVKQCPVKCYGMLNGRLPWQLQRLLKIKLQNEDGAFIEYWLALALTTIPDNSGNLDPVSKFVQVRKPPAAIAFQVFSVGNIVGCAHVIPEIATSSKTGDGRNKRWIINSPQIWWLGMMCIISKERIAFCAQVEGTRGVVFAASPIALQSRCKRVPNEHIPMYGHSWPSTPECSCKIGDRQSEKKRWNSDWMVICNVTHGIEAGRRVIRDRGVSNGCDGALPLCRSHSARTEIFFADDRLPNDSIIVWSSMNLNPEPILKV